MRIVVSNIRKELEAGLADFSKPIATAATKAIREAGDIAVRGGRNSIAAAGFGASWQEEFIHSAYPQGGRVSLKPFTIVRHRRGYARVFEEGATIVGKPFLYLPLPTAPRGVGGKFLRPKQAVAKVGPLTSIRGRGNRPLLVAKNAKGADRKPLYVGVPLVRLRRRFALYDAIARAAGRLGELYVKHLKV